VLRVRRLLYALPFLGLLLVAGLWVVSRSGEVSASPAPVIRACIATQGPDVKQNPETVDCLARALVDAVRTGQYAEVLALRPELEGTTANASCHAAGHAAGIELVGMYGMEGTIDRLFTGPEESVEYTCTAALVHGLVAGSTSGEPPFDFEGVAGQCLRLEETNFSYANECAHFFGHAVWRSVGALSADIAEVCSFLDSNDEPNPKRTCIGGAIMQKFDLQTKHYDPTNTEAQNKLPPKLSELTGLCDVFDGQDVETTEGCMGAVGWLAAVSTNDKLDYDKSGPEWDAKALPVYLEAVAVCDGDAECHRNFINHLRVNAYSGPVARELCVQAKIEMATCERTIDRYVEG
jgi:hypothetical protein